MSSEPAPLPSLDALLQAGVAGKRVLLRADLNTPLTPARAAGEIKCGADDMSADDARGEIKWGTDDLRAGEQRMCVADDSRLRAALGSLRRLLDAGARVVLISHLGRPQGKARARRGVALWRTAWPWRRRHAFARAAFTLAPVAARLGELLGREVAFCASTVGEEARAAVAALADGDVLLLENLRFCAGETRNDPAFAAALAAHADCYVNDAFGAAHRAHASVVGVARHFRARAAGDLLASELRALDAVRKPARPLLCLIGGAKVSDKLAVLHALARHADVLCIGGAMAYTFLHARGESTGQSLLEPDRADDARAIMKAARDAGCRLELPSDHTVTTHADGDDGGAGDGRGGYGDGGDRHADGGSDGGGDRDADGGDSGGGGHGDGDGSGDRHDDGDGRGGDGDDGGARVVACIPDDATALDIGPATVARFVAEVSRARTVFWNGPMGFFERDAFARGTNALARAVAAAGAHSVVGGGDSLAAVHKLGLGAQIGHLSTGGGASLEYIRAGTLPGVTALHETENQ